MTQYNEPKQAKPEASDTERSEAQTAKWQAPGAPSHEGKPDEGIRLDQLNRSRMKAALLQQP